MAWVGRLSYGLYLWHWPVILAVTVAPAGLAWLPGSTGLNLTRLALTFGIAVVSFYLLEQPVRRGHIPAIGRSGRRFALATAVSVILVSGVTFVATGASNPPVAGTTVPDCDQFQICVRHEGPAGAPVFAVIGDSIARSLDPAFVALAEEHGWTYVLAANNSCRVAHLRPADITPVNAAQLPICWAKTQAIQDEVLRTWRPSYVVMADLMETLDIQGPDGRRVTRGSEEAIAMSEAGLTEVADRITRSGARFVLLKLPPRLAPDCQLPSNFSKQECTFRYLEPATGIQSRYDAMYDRLQSEIPGVYSISINSAVCPNQLCQPVVERTMLRWDGVHYTAEGAGVLVPTFDRLLGEIVPWDSPS